MRKRQIILLTSALLLFVASALAADVTGKWKGTMDAGGDTVFTIKADGAAITGSMTDPEGKERPLKGTVDGDKISFTVDSEWQGNPVKLVANGTVKGDEMTLTLGTEGGEWSTNVTAKRAS